MKGTSKYEFRNFFNQRGTSSLSQREGTDFYSDQNIRKWESLYTGRTTYSGQLSGEHKLREDMNKPGLDVRLCFRRLQGTGSQGGKIFGEYDGW